MEVILLISILFLVLGWIISIGSLYFAVKQKENGNVKKSKLWFTLMLLGDCAIEISWYSMIVSLSIIIIQKIT